MNSIRPRSHKAAATSALLSLVLLVAACSSDAADTSAEDPTTTEASAVEESSTADTDTADSAETETVAASGSCEETAALFVTAGSVNADLADPEVSGTCDGDNVVITSNGIPDYTYIETSPGSPAAGNYTFTIPATPTMADEVTDVPDLGTAAVALNGVPIYGPTEGTGGDVLSLAGALSECGSHNGPTGFHIHQILTTDSTDCLFSPAEVAAAPQLVGYAFDDVYWSIPV